MKIVSVDNGWIEANMGNLKISAKVYDTPSKFGILQGRISKLAVKCTDTGSCLYNWDRGPDIDKLAPGELMLIVTTLETLI
jgi:hypothetical protein